MNGRQRLVRAVVYGVLPAALLAALVAVPAAAWSRLPDRIADHWNFAGMANGAAARPVPFLILGGLGLAGAAILWGGAAALRHAPGGPGPGLRRPPGGSLGTATPVTAGLFMIAVATASCLMVAVANAGVSDWRQASVGAGGIIGVVGGSAVLTAAASYLLRRFGGLGATDDGSARPSLGLRKSERAIWTGRARAGWAALAGIALLAGGALLAWLAAQWGPAVALFAAGVATFGFTSVRVTVAARGVTVGYGPLGLRLTRIPLRRITRAEVVDLRAFSFGYRGSLTVFGSAAVILRRGPALSLTLRDGKAFTVTVDDAATGAALLNDLIAASQEPVGG